MRVDTEIRYEADPEAVATMLADPAFVSRKCESMGALDHSVSIEGDVAAGFSATSSRTMATDTFPDVARRFVGETVVIRQVDAWEPAAADGSRDGTLTVEIAGAPIRVTGRMRLAPVDGGTVQTVDADLKASVPLLGGKLEKAAHPAITAGIRKEHRTAQAWLAQ